MNKKNEKIKIHHHIVWEGINRKIPEPSKTFPVENIPIKKIYQ